MFTRQAMQTALGATLNILLPVQVPERFCDTPVADKHSTSCHLYPLVARQLGRAKVGNVTVNTSLKHL